MLPAAHRLTDGASFREATRGGKRASSPTLVAHLLVRDVGEPGPRVGFVVSKAVGNSVVRSRVQRRLRHLARRWVEELAPGSVLVVRALPGASDASSSRLGRDLTTCLRRLGVVGEAGS